jgi:hypothetical protein
MHVYGRVYFPASVAQPKMTATACQQMCRQSTTINCNVPNIGDGWRGERRHATHVMVQRAAASRLRQALATHTLKTPFIASSFPRENTR